jgi:putative copper resistance protein D
MEAALALCRFVHFLSAMALFGFNAYVALFAAPGAGRGLEPAGRRGAAIAIPLALVSALGWLALEAAAMSDGWGGLADPDALRGVLTDTAFGLVWQGRLVVALVLVGALALGRHGPSLFLTLASALLLGSLALVGHAAMQNGALGVLHRANHAVHLLATGAWLGGLPAFALCLRMCRDPALRGEAMQAMRRFSFWGQFDVALVVLTGVVNIALTSGAPTLWRMTPYRALLLAKIALVAFMIAIALFNRYILAPRLRRGERAAEAVMKKTSVAEIVLGAVVVALVSLFGLLEPF